MHTECQSDATTRVSSPFRSPQEGMLVGDQPGGTEKELVLREMTGFEEEYLESRNEEANTGRTCNEVLARCLVPPGSDSTDALTRVRGLSVAERDRALVRLRQQSLGDEVESIVWCPECEAKNEVHFHLRDLPLDFESPPERVEHGLGDGRQAVVRVPTAGDQEQLLALGFSSGAERRTWLLSHVLERLGDDVGPFDVQRIRGLPIRVRSALETAIAEATPELDLTMSVRCEGCEATFTVPFEAEVFFCTS